MCTVAHGMGSGWEQHIARLIDQAHETLSSSAYSRRHHLSGSAPSPPYGSVSSPYRGSSTPLRSAPATFRGDRGASYRRGSEGWDASSFVQEPSGGGACPSPSMAPPPPPFSRLAGARVHDARIDGLEDRVKLEVQTVVRRDVDHRVSIAERAVEHLRHCVEELAEEVSSLGEVSRKCSASTKSHTGTLEQILAGEERSRSTLVVLEKWRADREGWCARTDDSLASLSENARALTRRAHTQQKALDEAAAEQEDLAASVKSSRKAGDAAAASAVAPVREHFLKEIGTIRRRLLALEEEGATVSGVPQVTKALVKATAEDVAAAKGEELRTAMEAHVRGKVARGAEEAAAAAVTARREIERRLAEVERWLGTCDSALGTLRRSGRETSADVPGLQDDMSALQQQLADGLSRMEDLCERRLREARQAAQQQALKLESERAVVTQGLDDRLKKLEELERLSAQPPSADIAPAVAAPSASMEKVEELADTVRELVSGAASTTTRQENFENRMEELSEELCGHSLKLSCLEGLWREPQGVLKEKKAVEEAKDVDSDVMTATSDASAGRRSEPQTQQQKQQKQPQQQLRASAGEGYAPSLTTPIRAGLSGLLKRLGSTSSSSSQGEVGVKSGNKGGAAIGTRRQSSAAAEPEEAAPPQDVPKQSTRFESGGAVLEAVSEAPSGEGCPAEDTENASRSDDMADGDIGGREEPGNQASDTNAGPIHHRPNSGDSSSSAATLDSGAREGASSAGSSSSSRARASPDENTALREGRAAQALSEGGDREPSRDVDTTLPASDEKGAHSSDNAEDTIDAATTGVVEHEGKGTQDASMAQDASMQSQREGSESASGVAQIGTEADRSASEPHDAIATATEGKGAKGGGQIVQQTTDLEMSGSVEGSEHSRWSLPSVGGIGGVGGLREERSVWAGLADIEDSMGSVEQAPSSATGDRGGDDKSPRSRVESYDLQQEEGDDYMVPFSPDRDSVGDGPAKASPGITASTSKAPGGGSRETTSDDTPGVVVTSSEKASTVADSDIDAATTTTPAPPLAAAVSSPPEPTDTGGGGALSTVQSFCFSDDDDDDDDDFITEKAAEPERLSAPFTASTAKGDGLKGSKAGIVREGGSERGHGSDSSSRSGTDGGVGSSGGGAEPRRADGTSDPTQTGSGDGGEEQPMERQSMGRRRSSGVLPNPDGFDGGKPSESDRSSPAEGGEGLALARSTTAAGPWPLPDLGFSSDDELNLDLSSSGISSSRQAEGKGEDEQMPPPSSSPLQGSYDGFDSSSVAS